MPTLEFKGKSAVQYHHLAVPHHQLVPNKKNSLTDKISLNDNLIVQGDNLLALKALLPTYAGKVKCIYIDPPYNTGNEAWVYNDKVNSPIIKDWIGQVVGKEGEDFTRHDKWLCMMLPRLKLLRELLSEEGVIFVSIDENEVHHLRNIMDDVFNEDNFISQLGWQKVYSPKNQSTYFSNDYEFVVCYAKNIDRTVIKLLPRSKEMNARFKNPDNDLRGVWKPGDMVANEDRKEGRYEIESPTGKKFNVPVGKHWSYSKAKMLELIKDNRIYFGKEGNSFPSVKQFLSEVKQGRKASSLLLYKDFGHTDLSKKEIKEIFFEQEKIAFDTPKPSLLIKNLIRLVANKDSIVLDSFAGSGTTAQAVLELNKEDGGNRKFILVEMEGYANNITAERVRRVIKGVPTAKNPLVKEGLGGTFSYFELGDPIQLNNLLAGNKLPNWQEMARYVYYTTTGEEFDDKKANAEKYFAGKNETHAIFVFYKPDLTWLKDYKFTLKEAEELHANSGTSKHITVYAPAKYVDNSSLEELNMSFCQLPYEIYKLSGK